MIDVVVGAQYGSEGKGVIVSEMARRNEYAAFVRVGGPNAGHSHRAFNRKWAQRMLPVGWAHSGPASLLILGRGAVVSPDILQKEITDAEGYTENLRNRVIVDEGATWLQPRHESIEGKIYGDLHRMIGSTGEGVGAARRDRMARNISQSTLMGQRREDSMFLVGDTVEMLDDIRRGNSGSDILVEGTQGSGLSLVHGPWPFVTTADVNAAGIMADVGIAPGADVRVVLVARTYPIRVAGNSGPMFRELTWDEISTRTGKVIQEHTTVTKLVRRVGEWDPGLFRRACILNNPAWIALTFMDYVDPDLEGETDFARVMRSHEAAKFIANVEEIAERPVLAVGTGGPEWSVAWSS